MKKTLPLFYIFKGNNTSKRVMKLFVEIEEIILLIDMQHSESVAFLLTDRDMW